MSAGLSCGLPFRLLGGILLLMALLDVPVAVTPATGEMVGALALFGVFADAGLLAWRRRVPTGTKSHAAFLERLLPLRGLTKS